MFSLTYPYDQQKAYTPENLCFAWTLFISPFENASDYHKDYKTYTLIVTSQLHKHDTKNLFDKIESACFNLAKHSVAENEQILNGLFLHLPMNASVASCHEKLTDYFNKHLNKPVSFVVLYQPTIAMDIGRKMTVIHHHADVFWRKDRVLNWNSNGFELKFDLPVGIFSPKASTNMLVVDYPDGRSEEITSDKRYFYQHGNHYEKMKRNADGSFTGTMNKIANGVYSHAVWEFPEQSKSAVFSEISPPFDDLLIL